MIINSFFFFQILLLIVGFNSDNSLYLRIQHVYYNIQDSADKNSKNIEQGWTKEEENAIKNSAEQVAKLFNLSETDKKVYIECFLLRVKKKYPKGIKNLDEKEAYNSGILIGNECFKQVNETKFEWNETNELLFRETVEKIDAFKDFTLSKKKSISLCVLQSLKMQYPKGLSKMSDEIVGKFVLECTLSK
jgi:hypothetical protein